MKVLMVNHPGTLKFKGGDLTQLRKTAEALNALGVQTGESFDPEPDATGYDVAHVFNLRTYKATGLQVQAMKRKGCPIAMSPIYLDPSVALWGNRVVDQLCKKPGSPDEFRNSLDQFAKRKLRVMGSNGVVWEADRTNRPANDYDESQRAVLRDVDCLLPNSYLEMNSLLKVLGPFDGPFSIVPYAVDATVFLDPDPEPFVKKYGLRDFILQVGRVEPSKNQFMLCYALRELDLPLVLIGGNLQPQYLGWCKEYGPRNLTIIPHLPPDELRSAYAAARLHVLPSWIETCGLVTMEAALADCNIVSSTAGYELEYWQNLAYYCDPADHRSICRTVIKAYDNFDRDRQRRQSLRNRILKEFTWERAARLCLDNYEQMLKNRGTAS